MKNIKREKKCCVLYMKEYEMCINVKMSCVFLEKEKEKEKEKEMKIKIYLLYRETDYRKKISIECI